MTHQSKISSSIEMARWRQVSWPVALAILVLGITLGVITGNLSTIGSKIDGSSAPAQVVGQLSPRPNLLEPEKQAINAGEAEAARYADMAKFYLDQAQAQRAIEAEAARYSGLAELYLPENAANGQRALEAEAARYGGMAEFYLAENLAWPPRPTQFHSAENAGVSLDDNALAAYHQSERDFTSIVTSRIEENPLDAYHQSEWGLTPSAVRPSEADALAAYHQSEWGRPLNPGLPSVKHETDADQDLGLMDFSPGGNEVGMQRHDREYGLAAVSHLPEIDADQDIGLMESFAAPDETSQQRIEPGTLEALPNIDPADRKFFSPGYGAMSGGSKEAEVLSTIDPADRKFFNPGYGAQTTGATGSEAILPSIENEIGEWSAVWLLLK